MMTTQDTILLLSRSIVTRLENQKSISFNPRKREVVFNALAKEIGPDILTQEDLRSRTLERMGAKAGVLVDSEFSESDQYRAAQSVIKSTFGDDELHGLFFQRPLRIVAEQICKFLMANSEIDDVFEDDEVLARKIVELIQKFNPSQQH